MSESGQTTQSESETGSEKPRLSTQPSADMETQIERHKPSLFGMAFAIVFVLIMVVVVALVLSAG